jgi:hypothetical protein
MQVQGQQTLTMIQHYQIALKMERTRQQARRVLKDSHRFANGDGELIIVPAGIGKANQKFSSAIAVERKRA